MFKSFARLFHTTIPVLVTAEKSALSALRKKTGYTFINCKKALEMHDNDLKKAEKWLVDQAQHLGWSKATKLADRSTGQGLVGVFVDNNVGAMVEINCETDFVARNENFKKFVDETSRILVKYTAMANFEGDLWKLAFDTESLKTLVLDDDKTLGDHLALLIGTVGENASIRRAICFRTMNDCQIAGYAHPSPVTDSSLQGVTQMGKFGTLVVFRGTPLDEDLQKNLCQHIVGLNPERIGKENLDEPAPNKDDEKVLIYQEYLLDSDKTVGEVLKENNTSVFDYHRFECGENHPTVEEA